MGGLKPPPPARRAATNERTSFIIVWPRSTILLSTDLSEALTVLRATVFALSTLELAIMASINLLSATESLGLPPPPPEIVSPRLVPTPPAPPPFLRPPTNPLLNSKNPLVSLIVVRVVIRGMRGVRASATERKAFAVEIATFARFWKVFDSLIVRIRVLKRAATCSNCFPSGCNASPTSFPSPLAAPCAAISVAASALLKLTIAGISLPT